MLNIVAKRFTQRHSNQNKLKKIGKKNIALMLLKKYFII